MYLNTWCSSWWKWQERKCTSIHGAVTGGSGGRGSISQDMAQVEVAGEEVYLKHGVVAGGSGGRGSVPQDMAWWPQTWRGSWWKWRERKCNSRHGAVAGGSGRGSESKTTANLTII